MTRKVLTVDDSQTMRDMIAFTLRDAGFTISEAADGEEALAKLKSESFDLLITDVNMPRMDGITLVKTVRSENIHKGKPILVLTTEGDQDKRMEGREAGATGWVVKPFDPEKLIQVANKVCQ